MERWTEKVDWKLGMGGGKNLQRERPYPALWDDVIGLKMECTSWADSLPLNDSEVWCLTRMSDILYRFFFFFFKK